MVDQGDGCDNSDDGDDGDDSDKDREAAWPSGPRTITESITYYYSVLCSVKIVKNFLESFLEIRFFSCRHGRLQMVG